MPSKANLRVYSAGLRGWPRCERLSMLRSYGKGCANCNAQTYEGSEKVTRTT
jgi:hypothetical protein